MTAEASQSNETPNSEANQSDQAQAPDDQRERRRSERENGGQRRGGRGSGSGNPTYFYDPQSAARTGLLSLAAAWKEAGSTYQAMHAYIEVLTRYPQTGAAAAATEGLVDLANTLEKQGRFYAALDIFRKLETLL